MTDHATEARFAEPRRQSAAEVERWAEYNWLQEQKAKLRAVTLELVAGYPLLETPQQIDEAICIIERAEDEICNRMSRLDEGEE